MLAVISYVHPVIFNCACIQQLCMQPMNRHVGPHQQCYCCDQWLHHSTNILLRPRHQSVERHNRPEVEFADNPELLLPPVYIEASAFPLWSLNPSQQQEKHSPQGSGQNSSVDNGHSGSSCTERCLIEGSINSVRVSIRLSHADALESQLATMYTRFLMQRADTLPILRRVPIEGYDVSFLVCESHVRQMGATRICTIITSFVEEADAEVTDLKLTVNARGRAMATEFLRTLAY